MSIQTREDVLEEILKAPRPNCPHCAQTMSIYEVPPINYSDGLGWGVPYLYVCFNDACPPFCQGWDEIKENYAHTASTRCLIYPGTTQVEYMPVFGKDGGKGQIMEKEIVEQQKALEEEIKKGFLELAECFKEKDHEKILQVLLDAVRPARVRLKAAQMMGDFGVAESIEPMKNLKAGNDILVQALKDAVAQIHERTFTRECPFCAEVIKIRANICKHCGKEVAGV